MFCTPTRTLDARSNGSLLIHTWRFVHEQDGAHVELPIAHVIAVQVIDGAVTLQASLDRKHWQDVATLAGPCLEAIPLFARYLRANGRGLVHVMVRAEK